MSFNYCNTTKVFCSADIGSELKDFILQCSFQNVLLLSGGEATTPYAEHIAKALDGLNIKLINGIVSNPLEEKVNEIVASLSKDTVDVICTVGGGSVHDTGKAVAVMLCVNDGELSDYTVNGKYSVPGIKKAIPVITVPTLCGSGAEVSPAALIRIGNEKRVIFSSLLHPMATFISTNILKDAPSQIIKRSSFDSFIQALEGYISTAANSISDAFAKSAIENYVACIPALLKGTIDDSHLEKLAIASIFSSYVCSTASVGAIHAISDPISGRYNVHHATALAMVAKTVLKKNLLNVETARVEWLNKAFGFDGTTNECFVSGIDKLICQLGILSQSKKIKIDNQTMSLMIKESFNPDMAGNPYEFTQEEVCEILEEWYDKR